MKNLKPVRSVMFAAIAACALSGTANAADLVKTVTLSDVASNTYLSWEGNTIVEIDLGARAHLNTMAWDVTLTANQGSMLNEAYMQLSDSKQWSQLYFLPSFLADPNGGYHAGTEHYSGSVDFRGLDTDAEQGDYSFSVGPDGILRLEFAENIDSLPGADAVWNSATFTFGYSVAAVPEPSTYAMMLLGFGALSAVARRRKPEGQGEQ
ncbi:PEP-CTERM sorting domain-containing protein [Pseudoduganella lutea]|uniref:PEP-CTERM sorting domain-containing protein n=1 Tax=Pseudoduganella lutea TaxID=321985 RepID=A0A4P6L0B3_9BURK|nr:PEP-CTERM sorting domain-containing protein [Pseudoduganella lutea]QBE64038.1 PEP-CTERM sorting domain-containing protein [Pseudoduganella lutea]